MNSWSPVHHKSPNHDHNCEHTGLAQKPKTQRASHCCAHTLPSHQPCSVHSGSGMVLGWVSTLHAFYGGNWMTGSLRPMFDWHPSLHKSSYTGHSTKSMPRNYLLNEWKHECMPPSFLSGSCEVLASLSGRKACWPCSHPCQCLGAWAAACQVSPGRSPGWRAMAAASEPSFCQGHLWSLCCQLACLCRKVPPQCQAPTSPSVYHLDFSLCQLFLDFALWTSHHHATFRDVSQTFCVFLTLLAGSCCRRGNSGHLSLSMFCPVKEDTRIPR